MHLRFQDASQGAKRRYNTLRQKSSRMQTLLLSMEKVSYRMFIFKVGERFPIDMRIKDFSEGWGVI